MNKKLYAIVDIETTGTFSDRGGITEIAIVVTDGVKVLETYESLVNPNANIPFFIENLTGISNQMVAKAPQFGDIAPKVAEILEGKIFVAHNVNFDYKYVKFELELAGYSIGQARLCTVRLSRQIIPGQPSYSLGKLTRNLGISHTDKHRAMSDTMATTDLFHMLVAKGEENILNTLKKVAKLPNLPANLPERVYNKLPNETGVYYFYNEKREIIDVGKAKDLKKRVTTHFTGKATQQKLAFYREVQHVHVRLTGTEMIASLLEDAEIKKHWPYYNRSQKSKVNKFGVFKYENQKDVVMLGITKVGYQVKPLKTFPSLSITKKWLLNKIDEFGLKASLCGMPEFDTLTITPDEHELQIDLFLKQYDDSSETYVLQGEGREKGEKSFVFIEKGTYKGYGFVPQKFKFTSLKKIGEYLNKKEETITSRSIIASAKFEDYLEKITI